MSSASPLSYRRSPQHSSSSSLLRALLEAVRPGKPYNGKRAEDAVCLMGNLLTHYNDGEDSSKAAWLVHNGVVKDMELLNLIK